MLALLSRRSLALLIFFFAAQEASGASAPLSFKDYFQLALKRSETVGIQDEALVQANELQKQAVAAVLPSISAGATFLRQDRGGSSSVYSSQDTIKLTATQPLFHGLREFATLSQRKAITAQQKALLQEAARSLFYDAVDAFYGTVALEADQRNYENELEVNRKRLKDLSGFRKVGRARTSEVLSEQANIASLEASYENVKGQLRIQREVLAFLGGIPANTPLKDNEAEPTTGETLDQYLAGISRRADLNASKLAVSAAESAVSSSKGLHWPSADLLGNYYLERPIGSSLKNSKWDVALVLSLPIFEWGGIQSQVRQAVSVQEQATLALSRSERLADQEVRRYFNAVYSGRAQLEKLKEFANLSKQNFEAQHKDYNNGLVTNLEVLSATSSWQVALRSLEHQALTVKADYLKLQAAAAKRPELHIESAKVD